MKRLIVLLAAAAAGAVAVQQKMRAQQAEQDLWAEVTGPAPAPPGEPPSGVIH